MVELLEALLPILFKIWKILNNIIVIAVILFILSIIGIVVSICLDNARAKKEKGKNLNKNKYTNINSVIVPQIAANIRKNESDIIREQNYLVGNGSAFAYRHNIKDENLLDFYKVISKEKIAYIDIKPKTRKQVYLYTKGDFSREILYNATDKEVSDMYHKYVSEKNVRKEASDWVDRYCFNNK